MNKFCKGCGEKINPKRLEVLPKTEFCVECSQTSKKQALTMEFGEGDHTYTDIVIIEGDIKDVEEFEVDDLPELLDLDQKEINIYKQNDFEKTDNIEYPDIEEEDEH